jgi:hypothetical protein
MVAIITNLMFELRKASAMGSVSRSWQFERGSGFSAGLTNLRDLSSVDPADSAAWRPVVRAAVAAARPAAAAEVQLRAVAVEERGAPPEAVEAADAPRLEAAVEARGAPRAAEVEALGARLEAVEVKAPGALPRPEVGVEVRGARPMAALVVGPAAVSAPAASQLLQHLASVVRMALSSAPVQAVFRAAASVGH